MEKEKVIINNEILNKDEAKVSIDDRGYTFGDGVYEVIRFYDKELFELEKHLDRFEQSCEELDIPFVYKKDKMKEQMEKLVAKSGFKSGYIYSQITRGVAQRNHIYVGQNLEPQYIAYVVQEEKRPLETMKKGIKVFLHEDIRWLKCNVKSLNLLGSVLAKNEAIKRGAKEAVFYRNGYITEGSATNIFVIKNGVVYTHPANHLILNGVTRRVVIKVAKELGYDVVETPFVVDFFENADEAFTTASITEITPIVEFEKKANEQYYTYKVNDGLRGVITEKLQDAFANKIFKTD